MWPLLRFIFFNAGLPTTDVVTDLINYLTLLPYHPRWAEITLTWMFTSFCVHAILFFIKQIRALWRGIISHFYEEATPQTPSTPEGTPSTTCINTWKTFAKDFYKEVLIHLPGIATFHNLWMAKKLYDLKWGTSNFKTEDHEQVVTILDEAGRCSHGESMYEAGPQCVTQVKGDNTKIWGIVKITFTPPMVKITEIVTFKSKWTHFKKYQPI